MVQHCTAPLMSFHCHLFVCVQRPCDQFSVALTAVHTELQACIISCLHINLCYTMAQILQHVIVHWLDDDHMQQLLIWRKSQNLITQ